MPGPDLDHLTPAEMTPKRGQEAAGLEVIEGIAAPLGRLVVAVAPLVHDLQALDQLGAGVQIVIEGNEDIAGRLVLHESEGQVKVTISGKVGGEHRGTPHLASWTGFFYRRAHPRLPFIVAGNHVEVVKNQPVAWAFITKGVEWVLKSPVTGIIHFEAEHEDPTIKDETVLYSIEKSK